MSFRGWSYRRRGGVYETLDERARILLAALGVVACLCTWDVRVLGVLAAAGAGVVVLARVTLREAGRFLAFAGAVVLLLVLLTFATGAGTAAERGLHALAQALRMAGLIAFTAVLPFTLDPARYGVALRRLGLPDAPAFAVELAVRFVPALAARFERTLEAQAARGLEVAPERLGPIRRLRRLVPLVVPVVMDSVLGGEDVADALELRAFGTGPRTWSDGMRFRVRDVAAVACGLALVTAALTWG